MSLPVEYTPLSLSNLPQGKMFDQIQFSVQEASHAKSVAALANSLACASRHGYHHLLPSELWGWARVLSRVFGRLNEVALARTMWEVYGSVEPGASLIARTCVVDSLKHGPLAFCNTITETVCAQTGQLLIRARDGALLTHDCEKPFFVEPKPVQAAVPTSGLLYENKHTVYFRFPWDAAVWVNNIHTDVHAQKCGFRRGLPEFVTYMDWVYHATVASGWGMTPFAISLTKVLPMYIGDVMDLIVWEAEGVLHVRFNKDGAERVVASVRKIESPGVATLFGT